jgi:hypothetical protein
MANHLTPTELARESGLERREVILKCIELGVPIFRGRIDKSLFLASLHGVATGTASSGGAMPGGVPTAGSSGPGIAAASAA